MRRAVELAAGAPDTRPNPRVGCVIVGPDGRVVGEGAHRGAGLPHAEVEALRVAGAAARGATAVVTLEPCDHTGRTGPCSEALIEAGVARVVFAQADPNPLAAGGAARLSAAGIEVESQILVEEALALNPAWTFAMAHRRPQVVLKAATTLDGRVAAADGSSRWITGPAAREQVQQLRAEVDAVLVGSGTVAVDDPQLSARIPGSRQPLRVVMGLRPVPAGARVRTSGPAEQFVHLATRDVTVALDELFRRDVHLLLVEGGPTITAAFLSAGMIDTVRWYVAGGLLGAGTPAVADFGVSTIADMRRFELQSVTRVGTDVRIDLRRA